MAEAHPRILGGKLTVTPEEAVKVYAELAERLMFKHVLEELRRIVGDRAAATILFRIVRRTMKEAVEEVLPEGMVQNPMDAMKLCYNLFAAGGFPFKTEVEGGNTFRVTQCPHYRFTEKNPLACVACAATKAGALEALTGERVAVLLENGTLLGPRDADIVVKRTHHMPSGDPYCRFELHVKRRRGEE